MNEGGRILLNAVFDEFEKNGAQMFICARLAPSEEEHMLAYYGFMQTKHGATVVDMGCGIGGFGHYLRKIDPSIEVINVTNDPKLIEKMEALGRPCVNASFEVTTLPDESADNVVFNESIGYGNLDALMRESSRLLKPGGCLVIKDFSPLHADMEEVDYEAWDYRSKRPDIVLSTAYKHGLNMEVVWHPKIHMDHWNSFMCGNKDMAEVWGENKVLPLCQTLYRFVKGPLHG